MKVLLINGSRRDNGCTFTGLSIVAKALNENGIETEIFNVGNREGESGNVRDSYAKCEGNVVSGYIITEPEYVKKYQAGATVNMYFYAVLSKAPQNVSGCQ